MQSVGKSAEYENLEWYDICASHIQDNNYNSDHLQNTFEIGIFLWLKI